MNSVRRSHLPDPFWRFLLAPRGAAAVECFLRMPGVSQSRAGGAPARSGLPRTRPGLRARLITPRDRINWARMMALHRAAA